MVLTPTADRPTRVARAAVFTVFGLNGFLLAMWVVHIPPITDRTGVAKSTLGMFILLMAGAGIVGMRIAGPLADRFGSRTLVAAAAIIASVAVIGPGLATGPVTLAIALACFGFGNGALDVSMNTQAVHVERAYGRPIMAAFHALFSGGGLLGSLLGAATLRAGLDIRITLAFAAIGCMALTFVALPRLLRDTEPPATELHPAAEPLPPSAKKDANKREHSRKVLALAVIAFAVLLTEGVAADWSTLQMREHLDADAATAALAFGAFSVAMTAGRLATDRVSGAFGRVAVVRYGMLISALGLVLILASPWIPLTLLGWAMTGLGLSGSVPQIFTAAGNLGSDKAATDMSRVFSFGYLGLLAGPAVIGWLTAVVPLTTAMAVPLIAVLVCCRYAGVVAPARAESA
ncbi:MFS transporter [Nocardia sp. CA-128927]|uniref:MFS transporter n=1 Tax=Nocardia sp. CA-128927 TaxID=3239975 RepID=UPI003D986F47